MSLRWLLVGLDAVALFLSWVPTLVFHVAKGSERHPLSSTAVLAAAVVSTVAAVCFAWSRHLYRARVCSIKEREHSLLKSVAVVSAAVAAFFFHTLGHSPNLWVLVADGVLAYLLLAVGRGSYRAWLHDQRKRGHYSRPTVVVGASDEAAYWCKLVKEHPEFGVDVVGIVDDSGMDFEPGGVPWIAPTSDAPRAIRAAGASSAMVMVTAFTTPELRKLMRDLTRANLHIQVSTGLFGVAHERFTMTTMSHENLLYVERPRMLPHLRRGKRAFDIVVAGAVLLLTSPILAIAALAIKRHDHGPVFFRQQRVGRHGEHFRLYKLRTMDIDAEARRDELVGRNLREGPLFKIESDPRITKIGRILRATSIDELPQLVNVLRGQMSLVGPRPALPEEVAQFDAELLARHDVQPGITGLWQVEGRDAASFDTYHRLDIHYVENWSLRLDVKILCATVTNLMSRTFRVIANKRSKRLMAA